MDNCPVAILNMKAIGDDARKKMREMVLHDLVPQSFFTEIYTLTDLGLDVLPTNHAANVLKGELVDWKEGAGVQGIDKNNFPRCLIG